MIVEFVGGSLDGFVGKIERYFDYMTTEIGEIYYARATYIKSLNWTYVWYKIQDNYIAQSKQPHWINQ